MTDSPLSPAQAVAQLREEVESAEREARSLGEQLSAANTALEQEREAYAQLETQVTVPREGGPFAGPSPA